MTKLQIFIIYPSELMSQTSFHFCLAACDPRRYLLLSEKAWQKCSWELTTFRFFGVSGWRLVFFFPLDTWVIPNRRMLSEKGATFWLVASSPTASHFQPTTCLRRCLQSWRINFSKSLEPEETPASWHDLLSVSWNGDTDRWMVSHPINIYSNHWSVIITR